MFLIGTYLNSLTNTKLEPGKGKKLYFPVIHLLHQQQILTKTLSGELNFDMERISMKCFNGLDPPLAKTQGNSSETERARVADNCRYGLLSIVQIPASRHAYLFLPF